MPDTTAAELYEFVRLSDLPDLAKMCASFHATLTGDDSGDGLDMRYAAFRKIALDGEEEDGIVALIREGDRAGQVAGMAVLLTKELDAFDELGPWLTGLKMTPDAQDTAGLRVALVEQIEALASGLGYDQIFAHSADKEWFENHGYGEIEPFERDGETFWVFGKGL